MLNYQKIESSENELSKLKLSSVFNYKIKDFIKINLGAAYFITLTLLLLINLIFI
jgi:hypothetical protein